MNRVLVVAVHPDDETLGCGGTLLKHKDQGDEIHWLICTETKPNTDFFKTREIEIQKVSQSYKFDSVHKLSLKTMRVDEYSVSELIYLISNIINKIQPTHLYLPFKGDVHSDHRAIFNASFSCTKSFRYPFIKKIAMMETLSETDFAPMSVENVFMPNMFVDVSKQFVKKLEIMSIFESEIDEHPFPRSIKNITALATLRGAMAQCRYAESFVVLKEIL